MNHAYIYCKTCDYREEWGGVEQKQNQRKLEDESLPAPQIW